MVVGMADVVWSVACCGVAVWDGSELYVGVGWGGVMWGCVSCSWAVWWGVAGWSGGGVTICRAARYGVVVAGWVGCDGAGF